MTLRAERITTPDQVETLRQIRNATAEGYAHFNGQIPADRQFAWWNDMQARGAVHAWLYREGEAGPVAGFGLLRYDADLRAWVTTVGVLAAFRGRGFGKTITTDLVFRAPDPPMASARLDNPAAVALHDRRLWERLPDRDGLAWFRAKPEAEAFEQWARHGQVTA